MQKLVFIPSCEESSSLLQLINSNFNKTSVLIKEALLKKETPIKFIERIVTEKAFNINCNEFVLACHKSVFVGRRLISIPQNQEEIHNILKLYSGRNHNIHTAILLKRPNGTQTLRRTVTKIKIKNLSCEEIERYVASNLWQNKIGGYSFNSIFDSFIIKITGSMTGAQGLPLYQTKNILNCINETHTC